MKTYIFTPKIGKDGKQEVRRAKCGEYFEDSHNGPVLTFFNTANTYPILTLTEIGDELEGIKKVYNLLRDNPILSVYETPEKIMWSAISALAKAMKWGGK